jgi:hypothetical protein
MNVFKMLVLLSMIIMSSIAKAESTCNIPPQTYILCLNDVFPVIFCPADNSDDDGDGVSYAHEVGASTNAFCDDTDHDGITDDVELGSSYVDNPVSELSINALVDSDGDSWNDAIDSCENNSLFSDLLCLIERLETILEEAGSTSNE